MALVALLALVASVRLLLCISLVGLARLFNLCVLLGVTLSLWLCGGGLFLQILYFLFSLALLVDPGTSARFGLGLCCPCFPSCLCFGLGSGFRLGFPLGFPLACLLGFGLGCIGQWFLILFSFRGFCCCCCLALELVNAGD